MTSWQKLKKEMIKKIVSIDLFMPNCKKFLTGSQVIDHCHLLFC